MPKCQFTTKYYNYEIRKRVDFNCDEEESLTSGLCIFHDKDYLQNKTNYEEHKRKILDRLKHKVNHAISNNEPLLCIGFQLPGFRLSDLIINNTFTCPAYFNGSQFFGEAFFATAYFYGTASFFETKFQDVSFAGAHFLRLADFGAAHFQTLGDFSTAYFYGLANFFEAHFHGAAIFMLAHFHILSHHTRAAVTLARYTIAYTIVNSIYV